MSRSKLVVRMTRMKTPRSERCDGSVRRGRLLDALLTFVRVRFEVPAQELLPFGRRPAELIQQVRVVRRRVERVSVPQSWIRIARLVAECR